MVSVFTDLIYDLRRQYPRGVTTWSSCANECGNSARGGATCADYLEISLSAYIGSEAANNLREAICFLRDAEVRAWDCYQERWEKGDIVNALSAGE